MTTRLRLSPRTLDLLSGFLTVVAILLFVWTVDDSVTPVSPRIATVVSSVAAPAVVDTLASAIDRKSVV